MTDFKFYSPQSDDKRRSELLNNVTKNYGFTPNLFAYMAEAPIAVEAYIALQGLLAKASLSQAHLHVSQLTSSVLNDCEFCKVAHHAIGKQAGMSEATILSILNGTEIIDASDKAISNLTRAIIEKRGWLDKNDLSAFYEAGFTNEHVFELILAVATKTLSNYSNHITHPEANPELLAMI